VKKLLTIFAFLGLLGALALIGLNGLHRSARRIALNRGDAPPLFAAIDRGDLGHVDRLLAGGCDPNTTTAFDRATALDHAIWVDNAAIVKRLLQAHVDPNRPGMNAETPLISSIYRCKWQAFDALLDGGADPNAKLFSGTTPLTALFSVRAPIPQMRRLIALGADPNAVGMDKRTPLESAACVGTPESIDVLIELGTRCGPKEGWSALDWAVSNSRIDNMDCLLRHGVDVNAKGPRGETVFQAFVGDRYRVKIVWHLVEMGADPLRLLPDGRSPMDRAAMMTNHEMEDLLIAYAEKRGKKASQRASHP
jgi:ankyrin repeat protein